MSKPAESRNIRSPLPPPGSSVPAAAGQAASDSCPAGNFDLYDLALGLASTTSLIEGLRLCVDTAIKATGLDAGGFYLVDFESGGIELVVHQGLSPEFIRSVSSYRADSDRAQRVLAGRPAYVQFETMGAPLPAAEHDEGLRFLAVIPLSHGGRVLGSLNVASHTRDDISPACRKVLETIALEAAHAIARLRTEAALCETTDRLALALEGAELGTWDWNVQTGDVVFNERWAGMLGYTLAEIRPNLDAWEQAVHPQDMARVQAALQDHLEGRTPFYETEHRLRHKSGAWIWVLDKGKVIERDAGGRPLRACGTHLDITARKQAELSLNADAEFRRAVVERAADGLCVCHAVPDFPYVHFTIWNESMVRITGYTMDQINRQGWYQSMYPDPAIQASAIERMARMWEGDDLLNEEWEIARSDGSPRRLQISTSVVRDADGGEHVLALMHDVTEHRRAEQEKREMERRLLHAQKLESLGILAGGIAHDFNNILAGIMGYADLALVRLPASESLRTYMGEIKRAAQRAADLTRQMLAFSGKGKFLVEAVDLSQLIRDMRKLLEVSISKKAVLKFHLALDLPAIQADASQVHQIVLNLSINASEALGEQTGEIVISTDAVRLGAEDQANSGFGHGLPEGEYVRLRVADTGCGMDCKTLERIFDPFFTTKFTGRGLGLSAVQGIVRGHHGTLNVLSEPGKGTSFEICFPSTGRTAGPPGATAPAAAWRGSGTVLIVDDESLIRDLAGEMVEHLGFSVLAAADGAGALSLYEGHRDEIVAVVLDLTMPKSDGVQVFHALRRIDPNVRVVLSSGYNEECATERFSGLGLAGFIQKPYQLETLTEMLRKAVSAP